jgi:hypothetical protein
MSVPLPGTSPSATAGILRATSATAGILRATSATASTGSDLCSDAHMFGLCEHTSALLRAATGSTSLSVLLSPEKTQNASKGNQRAADSEPGTNK